MGGQLGPGARAAIGRRRSRPADDAVVVEHRLAVGGEPDVALEAGRAQPQGQRERLEGVLGGVGPGAPVGEADGRDPRAGRGPRPDPDGAGAYPCRALRYHARP